MILNKLLIVKVVASIIARLGSKRLTYKNILPFNSKPMLLLGIETLQRSALVDTIVLSTESELIARVAQGSGVKILRRPAALAQDDIPSVPVFQHIMEHFSGDLHVNLNVNFPLCQTGVVDEAINLAKKTGEALSVPYAVWAQTRECLNNYQDPWNITATRFNTDQAGELDVHTEEDLLETYRAQQGPIEGW